MSAGSLNSLKRNVESDEQLGVPIFFLKRILSKNVKSELQKLQKRTVNRTEWDRTRQINSCQVL
jgi:hypothetical protein